MPTAENQELREAIKHISHKFRTPLSIISSAAQMLKLQPGITEKEKDYLERQLRAIDKVTNILDELLDSVGEPTRHSAGE